MACFTSDSGGNVRKVIKVDEVTHDCDRNPGDFFIFFDVICQLNQLRTRLGKLLVAAPAFGSARQASVWAPGDPRMAIQTGSSQCNMDAMRKYDRLVGRNLS